MNKYLVDTTATAIENELILVTSNIKHFAFIKELKVRGWKDVEVN